MNNEEKILQMLEGMKADLAEVKAEQAEMKAEQAEMKAEQAEMKAVMATKEDLADTKVLMEAYFDPKFGLLADGLKLVQEKMLPAEAIDDTEERLDVLEAVVRRHSREIEKLKKAQ